MPENRGPTGWAYGDQPILITYRRASRASGVVAWMAFAAAVLLVAYPLAIRPWHLRWGASDEEVRQPLPGDGLIAEPSSQATRAVTIEKTAESIWPWLVQMGQGRGGMYSYDWLENLVGGDVHTLDRIVPSLQQLKVGDTVRLASETRFPNARLVVAEIQPGRSLVLRSPVDDPPKPWGGSSYTYSWAFVLDPVDERTTRLIARARYAIEPHLVETPVLYAVLEPIEFVMTQEMLRGIKERAGD